MFIFANPMRKILLTCCLLLTGFCFSQPKLVVGIVVDQMRYDYLEKYKKKFGPDGFKRLMRDGYSCENVNYNYVPTFTGPGHASIYTGTTPSVHGIVSNEWIDVAGRRRVYCTGDKNVNSVGSENAEGQMSPKNLFSSTITDELQTAKNQKSKIIGISLKDRGAILPAGKNPTGVYWYDGKTGNWITSTYYMKELPKWVSDFNKKELPKKYLSQPWTTLLPIEKYTESDADDNECEELFKGKDKPTFPYDLPSLMKENGDFWLIKNTPFGNTITKDMAIEAIKNESMGKDTITDFLALSFSSTDYIGHKFGPQSVEVEDCYLRLDKDIAELLKFLDESVGKQNYLLFLTSDHGASDAVLCSQKKNVPAGVLTEKAVSDSLKKFFLKTYKDTLLLAVTDFDVYLSRERIEKKKLNIEEVQKAAAKYLRTINGIADAVSATEIKEKNFQDSIRTKIKSGYNNQRSGDIIYVLKPNWLLGFQKGTSHGSPYWYDTHVPLIFFGWKIKKGSTDEPINITDIAPTICSMLNIPNPSGCNGIPIKSLTK